MSESEEHNELIHRLAERLRNHAEPYKDGAWERFASTYRKPRRILWPYWSAAATLLVAIGLYWYTSDLHESSMPGRMTNQDMAPTEVERRGPNESPKVIPRVATESAGRSLSRTAAHRTDARETELKGDAGAGIVLFETPPAIDTVLTLVSTADLDSLISVAAAASLRVSSSLVTRPVEASPVEQKDGKLFADPIAVNRGAYQDAVTNSDGYARAISIAEVDKERWDLGFVLSPSLTSEAVNIGGGVAVAYRVSDKLSIGSGISIAQLGVGENPNHQPRYDGLPPHMAPSPHNSFNGESAAAVDYKREVSVTSNVVTLDIPLDLRYEVANGLYTSLGVSYVAVLNERRTSHIVDRLNKNTFASGQSTSVDRLTSTEFVYSSERIDEKPLLGNGYAGFMNFSVGKKLPISSKLSLSIEPYFKLPIGRLSKEEMNFTNGGIRLVTGF